VRPGRRAALVIAAAALSWAAGAQAQSGTILGRTRVAGTELALGYAIVSITPGDRELFSDGDGRFVIRGVATGRVRITAHRVGFTPVDTTIEVARGDTTRVDIGLSLITIRLPAVHSLAKSCAHPGGSDAQIGVELAALFDQVKENADRNRLLSRSYPFELEIERRITRPEPLLEARFVAYDTILRSSIREWRYAPGKMLGTREYASGVFAGKWSTITLPELADFADERFLINHCFDFGGVDVVNGDSLIRIDFSPAPAVHDPDVAGTMFLDPKTYQLRITDITLVNLNRQLRGQISGQSVRANFREVIPGVPVLDAISSVVYPKEDAKAPAAEAATEHHRILSVRFLRGKP
jgi:Carboxypeptidase regulatory-like domain